jgi:hypothetical protein
MKHVMRRAVAEVLNVKSDVASSSFISAKINLYALPENCSFNPCEYSTVNLSLSDDKVQKSSSLFLKKRLQLYTKDV